MVYTIGCSVGNKSTVEDCLAYFKDKPKIQIDTETTGRDCHKDKIISLQIGDSENQWFIDTRNVDILLFKNLIENKYCLLQNAKFDYKMLKKVGINLETIYDTMLAECVLYCGYEKWGYGLAKLVERYLQITMSKEERMTFTTQGDKPFTLSQIEYGALDVKYLEDIHKKQLDLINLNDLNYCLSIENEVVKALGDIEYNGMFLYEEDWRKLITFHQAEQVRLERELDAIVLGDKKLKAFWPIVTQGNLFGFAERELKINYASPLQIKSIASKLGVQLESTNDRELTKLAPKYTFFKVLQEYRGIAKIISTYGESFLDYINPVTGRVHTDFWQIKDTGRVSSGSKEMNAPNVQNLPAMNKFRNCFKARSGFKWVSIDYSGQELRLMADASGEEGFIDVLNRGEDLHCYAGSMMFKRPITKADKDLRNKAKTINFGKPYGMGASKLADTLSITLEEAEQLFKEYAAAFPKLNSWLEKQGKFAIANGYTLTFAPSLRRRWYPDIAKAKLLRKQNVKDKATWKEIMIIESQTQRNGGNSPIQGSAADICKEALVSTRNLVFDYNKEFGEEVAFMICTVHDAIDFEIREDLAEKFAKEAADRMIEAGNKYVTKVNMDVDVNITEVWQK